ncbi:hypothetical protein [Agathobacter rectalis]|uniref:hypothetical protein n=1 Tax=Agathobacter rectalis TaxID=39491 RepID=UPI0026D5809B|nr:hypothetical protein [Agathobacter rectalis]
MICVKHGNNREKKVLSRALNREEKPKFFDSVQCGDYSTARGAQKLNLSIDEFKKQMMAAGFSIPQ